MFQRRAAPLATLLPFRLIAQRQLPMFLGLPLDLSKLGASLLELLLQLPIPRPHGPCRFRLRQQFPGFVERHQAVPRIITIAAATADNSTTAAKAYRYPAGLRRTAAQSMASPMARPTRSASTW